MKQLHTDITKFWASSI